jgi:ferredoxin-thioredoxin reductase catalytic chain
MMDINSEITGEEIERLYIKLKDDAESGGYHLNPDVNFTRGLVRGLLVNQRRYGYQACPCRLASGKKERDLDIICPCNYRDPDLDEYGACYCALYVGEEILEGKKKVRSIPERRFIGEGKDQEKEIKMSGGKVLNIKYLVWRCKVCGYLCAREKPPEICPVCKAKRERFEIFIEK